MSERDVMDCGEFSLVAAELALGVLPGRERADALAHMERCDACRESVRQLAMTGEELLLLLPAVEPPPGFETRVMDRIGIAAPVPPSAARHRAPRRSRMPRLSGKPRRLLAAGAVALGIAAAALGGWGLGTANSPARSPSSASPGSSVSLSSAMLVAADRQTVGRVFYYPGPEPWMYMSVDLPSGAGTVTCQLRGPDGRYTTVGSFRLDSGYGSWGGAAPWNSGKVTGARVLGPGGKVLATASFS